MGTKPTILQMYKQCVRPMFEHGVISSVTVSDTVIIELQKLHNSFIRLAFHLPRNISTRLSHETSRLPYIKDRLLAVATGQLRNSSRNSLVEHTINTAMSNDWIHIPTPLTLHCTAEIRAYWVEPKPFKIDNLRHHYQIA